MSLDFYTPPTVEEIIAKCKTYIKGELKELNPTDKNSVVYSLIVAMANLSNDNNKQILLDILPNVFPQYCKTEESLENHAYIKDVPRTTATSASGKATIQGTRGSVIPLGTTLFANNVQYKNQNTVSIQETVMSLSSLKVNGTLVTATTASNHNFASNIMVNISGAENPQLNGDFPISVNGLNTFTYNINEEVVAEETNNLTSRANLAVLNLKCVQTGAETNLSNGDALSLSEQIEGVNSNAYTQYSGISGGTNIQSFNDWKDNVVNRYRNPITSFNKNNIEKTVLGVSGVTRVWVYPITPAVGQCTIFFIRGNDDDIIPDANEVEEVYQEVIELRTVKDNPNDVFVKAPEKKVVDFVFNKIVPDTPTMRDAIKNSLKQLFEDEIELGEDIDKLDYETAIKSSFDMETGSKLKSYSLENPKTDIEVDFGEFPVLGNVSFL